MAELCKCEACEIRRLLRIDGDFTLDWYRTALVAVSNVLGVLLINGDPAVVGEVMSNVVDVRNRMIRKMAQPRSDLEIVQVAGHG